MHINGIEIPSEVLDFFNQLSQKFIEDEQTILNALDDTDLEEIQVTSTIELKNGIKFQIITGRNINENAPYTIEIQP